MTTPRDNILAKVRASLGRKSDDTARRAAVTDRLQRTPKGVVPRRGQLPQAEKLDLFCKMAEAVQASVARVASTADVPQAVTDYLRQKNLPAHVRMGADAFLAEMPWSGQKNLTIESGRAKGSDEVGLSHALAGVAETGTLVLASGPDNPTTINFLPEHHIAVIRAADIEGDMEAVWTRIRATYGKGEMPRVVNMITGPSRSGDIEQTILLGAHGPRAVHIVVVEE
ncbi:lactate utilization protein [Stappia sp. F7233]|uniref:Lactate utilization protein n=1 Tax=Stappia albiluteola TaxID=2758565 RepID=A0A839AHQ3_9HYPH|nr:lactate utilization protein [Stappia albiluteola]MBA5779251.1 lactate utilization protein [Stappia albiluteola]